MIIDDKFLTQEQIENIQVTLLESSFPWYLNRQTVPEDYETICPIETDTCITDKFQFTHTFYRDYFPVSDHIHLALELLSTFLTKHEIPCKALLRVKANFIPQAQEAIVQPPHVDHQYDHKVFLYYVNDSDGDTVIYNEQYSLDEKVTLSEKTRITPKAGRAILFDGSTYHSATLPVANDYRCVINITFI